MEKIDALRTQQGILTEISNIKTSNVQTEGKIYFTLGKTDCGTRSTKKEEKIKKQVKVSWFGLGLSTIQQLYAGKINMTNINISLRAASNAFITLPVFFLQWMWFWILTQLILNSSCLKMGNKWVMVDHGEMFPITLRDLTRLLVSWERMDFPVGGFTLWSKSVIRLNGI